MTDSSTLVFQYFFTAGAAVGAGLTVVILPAAVVWTMIRRKMVDRAPENRR